MKSQRICCERSEAQRYGLDRAVFINHLRFWIHHNRKKGCNYRDGKYWSYMSIKKIITHLPIWTPRQVERIIRSLVQKQVIITAKFWRNKGNHTLWYTFVDDAMIDGPLHDPNECTVEEPIEDWEDEGDIDIRPDGYGKGERADTTTKSLMKTDDTSVHPNKKTAQKGGDGTPLSGAPDDAVGDDQGNAHGDTESTKQSARNAQSGNRRIHDSVDSLYTDNKEGIILHNKTIKTERPDRKDREGTLSRGADFFASHGETGGQARRGDDDDFLSVCPQTLRTIPDFERFWHDYRITYDRRAPGMNKPLMDQQRALYLFGRLMKFRDPIQSLGNSIIEAKLNVYPDYTNPSWQSEQPPTGVQYFAEPAANRLVEITIDLQPDDWLPEVLGIVQRNPAEAVQVMKWYSTRNQYKAIRLMKVFNYYAKYGILPYESLTPQDIGCDN